MCVCQMFPALSGAEILAIEPPKTSQTSRGCRPQSSPQDKVHTAIFCIFTYPILDQRRGLQYLCQRYDILLIGHLGLLDAPVAMTLT